MRTLSGFLWAFFYAAGAIGPDEVVTGKILVGVTEAAAVGYLVVLGWQLVWPRLRALA